MLMMAQGQLLKVGQKSLPTLHGLPQAGRDHHLRLLASLVCAQTSAERHHLSYYLLCYVACFAFFVAAHLDVSRAPRLATELVLLTTT